MNSYKKKIDFTPRFLNPADFTTPLNTTYKQISQPFQNPESEIIIKKIKYKNNPI